MNVETVEITPGSDPAKSTQENNYASFRPRFSGWVGLSVVVLAVLCGLATYLVLTGLTPVTPTRSLVLTLLAINLFLVFIMMGIVGGQLWSLYQARRKGIAGAGLHTRIVSLLGIFAVVPALIVAVFATVTLNRGLDAWFSERTQSIVETAITVAEAYIQEQGDVARVDITAIAEDMDQQKKLFDEDRTAFSERLATHAAFRSLSGAFVINAKLRRVEASVTANEKISFRAPSDATMKAATAGDVVIEGPGEGNVIRAILKLKSFDSHYLYVYRLVNPSVVEQLSKAKAEKLEYDHLLEQRLGVQLTFALMYVGVTFIFLLAAIYLGLWFADRLVEPVVQLVYAARKVSDGDLATKVTVSSGKGDLSTLGRTFNQMTGQLQQQRNELVAANEMIDDRRRFTEAVLLGVSAGVIGLDSVGHITLANRAAAELLDVQRSKLTGADFSNAFPAMRSVYKKARSKTSGSAQDHVNMRVGIHERNFVVRVTTEPARDNQQGYVVTFDDITELVSAQRNSAWADIARRIAHEIKNPLTPIQLSAERLKRKYGKEIVTSPEVFSQCTDTIIRQVGDIGRMVDEFSSFARMPSAQLENNDLVATAKEAILLQKVSSEEIKFDTDDLTDESVKFPFDRRLVSQAIINLVKNATEAIEGRMEKTPEPAGSIKVSIIRDGDEIRFTVADNGIGLPTQNRARLTEPYMTTREKGTGLGLAIVQRIMEEHGGSLSLSDAPQDFYEGMGAEVALIFSLSDPDDVEKQKTTVVRNTAKEMDQKNGS